MTEAQAIELISGTFAAAWPISAPGIPFALENETLPSSDSFALLTTIVTASSQATHGRAGTRKTRRNGWIQVKLWSPANAGMRRTPAEVAAGAPLRGAELADAVRGILEMVALPSPLAGDDPVTTLAETGSRRGAAASGEDGRWYMTLIRIPFWYVETK